MRNNCRELDLQRLQPMLSRNPGICSIVAGAAVALTVASPSAAAPPNFKEIVIDAGFHVEQPVLAGNLLGDEQRHIILAGHDDDHRQRLAVYRLSEESSETAAELLSLVPGPNLIAYDVGRLGDQDALFFIEPGRILRYDFAAMDFVELAKIRTIYAQERTGEIMQIDFIRDVNADGRDDLVVADTAGYRVRLQLGDGSLGDEVLLQESSSMTVSDGIVSFESHALSIGDMTLDGVSDLAVWRGNSLRVYRQLAGDRFEGRPEVMQLGLDLPSEAEMRVQQIQAGRGAVDQQGLTEKRIFSIEDLNNDGLPDILTEATFSEGVFDKRNEFRLHFGRAEAGRLVFDEQHDTMLSSEGLQFGLIETDVDGDGKQDLVVRKVRLSFGRVIRALLSGNVSLQLQFFRMNADDDYPRRPSYVAKTNVRFSLSSGHVDIPAIQVADFDADGLQDLAIQTNRKRLSIFHGVAAEQLFDNDPSNLEVILPRNGELVSAQDINDDGREDLVIRYNMSDGLQLARTVRLMIAEN
jgi:hypothetical protein